MGLPKISDTYTCTREITEGMFSLFLQLSLDDNDLHTKEDYAIAKGFSGRVGYGNILNLMVSYLVGVEMRACEVFLLSEQVFYRKPFYSGDTITLTASVFNVLESLNVYELKLEFFNQNHELLANGKCQVKGL